MIRTSIELDGIMTSAEPIWCDVCLLPSGVEVRGVVYDVATLKHVGLYHLASCADCGTWWVPA